MSRVVIVSNRLPVRIESKEEKLAYLPSEGGLATGLNSLDESINKIWIGWPGYITADKKERKHIKKNLTTDKMIPVFLDQQDIEEYYEGFSNKTIWPLFHYFSEYTQYNSLFWDAYIRVNEHFKDEVLKVLKQGDTLWIHDYQLMLLPSLIRNAVNYEITIGFFLHIPFPSYELFRSLPWRREILNGLLGADLIGFHTYEYMRHFMSAVYRILGVEQRLGRLLLEHREIKVDTFPMGIDYNKYHQAPEHKEVSEEAGDYRSEFGKSKLILSVDRLDYTKGILQRLKAFQKLLETKPEYRGQISLILLVVPSRAGVEQYQQLKEGVDEMVGRINGEFSAMGWTPVHYFYRSLPFNSLSALYTIADICLITPLRDGMNLVAKEFIASKREGTGCLILSEMTGASIELSEAIIINPNNIDEIVDALQEALTMPEEEQICRNRDMQKQLQKNNVQWWANKFMHQLEKIEGERYNILKKEITDQQLKRIKENFKKAEKRLLLLDYDGTLVSFKNNPAKAMPDNKLKSLISKFANNKKNTVVVISGRDREILQEWFKDLSVGIVAEHGVWLRNMNYEWHMLKQISNKWKNDIKIIVEPFVENSPGSFIEEKEYSLVWHYRRLDKWIADIRVGELIDSLMNPVSEHGLQILKGNKVIEIKVAGVNKGNAALQWIEKERYDFILAAGDDWTDEDMFKAVPEDVITVKVGFDTTAAKYTVKDSVEFRKVLKALQL